MSDSYLARQQYVIYCSQLRATPSADCNISHIVVGLSNYLILISVVHLAYFVVFGGFQVFVVAFFSKVKARHCCFKRPGLRGRFLAETRIRCSIFPSNAKKDSPSLPFFGQLGKILKLPVPLRTIAVSAHPVKIQRTTAQFEINISDRSCVTKSTYRMGAQSGERVGF